MSEIIDEIITKKEAIYAVNGVLAPYIPRFVGSYEKIPLDCYMSIIETPTVKAVPIEVLREIRAEIKECLWDLSDGFEYFDVTREEVENAVFGIIDKRIKENNE